MTARGRATLTATRWLPPGYPASAASMVTYGWGVIPVEVRIGRTDFRTSLFPKDERYLVPIKQAVRTAEQLSLGDVVTIRLRLDV